MKKILLLATGAMLYLLPQTTTAQTYSAWGTAINQHNNMYDTISASGDSLKFQFANTYATAWGTPKLVVYYEGKFGNNYMQVFNETLTSIGYTNPSSLGYDCSPEDSTVLNPTTTQINTWTANNSIVFTFIPNSGPGVCITSRVRARLVYNYCLSGLPLQYATPLISNSSVCATDAPYALTGTPTGGTFSGIGVTGSSFNPANLISGHYTVFYTATDSQTCTTTGSLNILVRPTPVVNNNTTIYACNGSSVNLTATQGNGFVWFSDAALTNSIAATSTLTIPSLTQTTNYWVAATDINNAFAVNSVTNTNFAIVDENGLAGDDRGGMAVTKTHIYLNGDNNAVRYDLNLTPASGVVLPIRDGMFSDLRNGKIWSLWNTITNASPINSPSQFTANALRGLDSNLNFTSEYVYLSQALDLGNNSQQNGIFAGFGYLGLYSGNTQHWYVIDMDNGSVSDLGYLSNPQFYGSENWSDWGVLESTCAGVYSVIYHANTDANIHRRILPNGAVTTVGTFTDLSDMASLTFNPWNNRWYWHYEGSSSVFGGSAETLGYADAVGTNSVCNANGLSCPKKVTVNVPTNVTFTISTASACVSNNAIPLNGGVPAGGTYSGIGVGTNTAGTVFYPALAGAGTYTITYTYIDVVSGCLDAASKTVTVNLCTGIEELTNVSGINVFPNPNSGNFSYTANSDIKKLTIEITDIQGRMIYTSQENDIISGITKQISLTDVAPGIYLVKMISGADQHVQRISIIR